MKKKQIIEFTHPGKQVNFRLKKDENSYTFFDKEKKTGLRFWNDDVEHKKKFLCSKGNVLKNIDKKSFSENPEYANIYFWGEWEPQSIFNRLNFTDERFEPNAIHYPFYSNDRVGRHNTDPYVFGDNFYYSNCKQGKNKIGIRELENGTLILFGTEYTEGFAVDTVFVVKDSLPSSEYLNNPNIAPSLLQKVTLNHCNLYRDYGLFRLYKGVQYSENQTIFSYVPCKTDKEGLNGFARPMINFTQFNLQRPGARTVLKPISYTSVEIFWLDLTAEIISQGFDLGINIDLPQEYSNHEDAIKNILLP
jgi:hypothetical protein